MADRLLTTVVGSYPQPDWLVDRAMLGSRGRVHWRSGGWPASTWNRRKTTRLC
jgi:hypothetical protein